MDRDQQLIAALDQFPDNARIFQCRKRTDTRHTNPQIIAIDRIVDQQRQRLFVLGGTERTRRICPDDRIRISSQHRADVAQTLFRTQPRQRVQRVCTNSRITAVQHLCHGSIAAVGPRSQDGRCSGHQNFAHRLSALKFILDHANDRRFQVFQTLVLGICRNDLAGRLDRSRQHVSVTLGRAGFSLENIKYHLAAIRGLDLAQSKDRGDHDLALVRRLQNHLRQHRHSTLVTDPPRSYGRSLANRRIR